MKIGNEEEKSLLDNRTSFFCISMINDGIVVRVNDDLYDPWVNDDLLEEFEDCELFERLSKSSLLYFEVKVDVNAVLRL